MPQFSLPLWRGLHIYPASSSRRPHEPSVETVVEMEPCADYRSRVGERNVDVGRPQPRITSQRGRSQAAEGEQEGVRPQVKVPGKEKHR
jgi:hypothetical protein